MQLKIVCGWRNPVIARAAANGSIDRPDGAISRNLQARRILGDADLVAVDVVAARLLHPSRRFTRGDHECESSLQQPRAFGGILILSRGVARRSSAPTVRCSYSCRSSCGARGGRNRGRRLFGTGEGCIATHSTITIGLSKGAELSFQHKPSSWCKSMLDPTVPSDLGDGLSGFGSREIRAAIPSDSDLQRADGSCRIVLSGSEKGTSLVEGF